MQLIKSKALYFLSKREYGYKELFSKLQRYSDDIEEIATLLNQLQHDGWLSEARYVASYLQSKKNKYGICKLKYELQGKISNPELINEALADNPIDEYEIALNLWQKKFAHIIDVDMKEKAKQMRFLQSRGFSHDVIRKVMQSASMIN